MQRRTTTLDVPTSTSDIVAMVAKVLLSDVENITLTFGEEPRMTVVWNQIFEEDLLPPSDASVEPPPVSRILREIEVKPSHFEGIEAFAGEPLQRVAYAMQLMGLDRLFCVGWLCRDREEVRKWMGLPPLTPMTQLLGVPVYVSDEADPKVLYLIGSRQQGGSIRSVHAVRVVQMEGLRSQTTGGWIDELEARVRRNSSGNRRCAGPGDQRSRFGVGGRGLDSGRCAQHAGPCPPHDATT